MNRSQPPLSFHVETYEVDAVLLPYLAQVLEICGAACRARDVGFTYRIRAQDYILDRTSGDLSLPPGESDLFDWVVMNPPYGKLNRRSRASKLLSCKGVDVTNLYSAFMLLAANQLRPGGEFVSITPRSFCNGPYFRPFRRDFFRLVTPVSVHLFESRGVLFRGNGVLQENIVLHGVAGRASGPILVGQSLSDGGSFAKERAYDEVFRPSDSDMVMHLITSLDDEEVANATRILSCWLGDLGVTVSTGRVVDFRAREFLRVDLEPGSSPLIFPRHIRDGEIQWPGPPGRKPSAIVDSAETAHMFVPRGHYVLVKRFSAKEERRRIVAAVLDPTQLPAERLGFDNKTNYFHVDGHGMPARLARGLAIYLNSTIADRYFRLFSGHTQVNASDLRRMPYPSTQELESLSDRCESVSDQTEVDAALADIMGGQEENLQATHQRWSGLHPSQCTS